MKHPIVISMVLGSVACSTNNTNTYQSSVDIAQTHFQNGQSYLQQNQWRDARESFRQAIVDANLNGVDPKTRATYLHQYGKASAVVCKWSEAQTALKEAVRLDLVNKGPALQLLHRIGSRLSR